MHVKRVSVLCAAVLAAGLGTVVYSVQPSAAQAEPLSDCWSSDNGDPVLTSVTLSPTQVDVTDTAQTVRVTAAAEDTGGPGPAVGLKLVDVYVEGPGDNHRHVRMQPAASGEWTGTLRVHRWSAPGTWRIVAVDLEDQDGQQISYGGEDSRDLTTVPGTHRIQVTSGVTDPTPPVLRAFAMRPGDVDVTHRQRFVHVTGRARDDETGVAWMAVALFAPYEGAAVFSRLHKVPGTAHEWRGRLRMRRFIPGGAWKVYAVVLANRTGRMGLVRYPALERLGFDRVLHVVSSRDTTPPRLTTVTRTPAAVDVRTSSHEVTLTVGAADTGTGVRSVSAGFVGPGYISAGARMSLVSGNRHHGVWRGTARFRPCPSVSGRWHLAINILDKTHIANYLPARLRHLGLPTRVRVTARPDALRPRVHVVRYRVPLDRPLRLKFSEPVNGIDGDSATVAVFNLDNDSGGPQIAGQWRCRNGAGAPTSCATGRVRTAAFWPDTPLQPTGYFVELNPEHSLQITDMAGNPFDRAGVVFEVSAT